jgi:hypothetical protein
VIVSNAEFYLMYTEKQEAQINLTFTGPYIVIYSYSKTKKMHMFLQLFILVKHYMFRAVFPSIIRSSRLFIQQQAYVKQILLPAASGNEMKSSISFPLAAGSSICLTYACCCVCSLELLMMDGKTARNM